MIIHSTHSRAAILCFGGWGLQVMFHLLPRLQAAQEQRAAQGAAGADLSKITSFATVLAEPLIDSEGRAQFYVRQPRLEQTLPPFYIERVLTRLERESLRAFETQASSGLTVAEKRAMLLLAATEAMLQPLDYGDAGFFVPAQPSTSNLQQSTISKRATRGDLFNAALTHAEHMARLLETCLLDPIRQDLLLEDDPFVQTTLYVVAPLYEPLTAALIWPLVAQLMKRAGRQHIAQVIGLFATGSYATDMTRSVEDAAAFAALCELETLTGVRHERNTKYEMRNAEQGLRKIVAELAPTLSEQVGQPLFDFAYLLDREKSNQGLAQNSHELAVVAANALEALSLSGGNLFIQEQLGLGLYGSEARPYSLIGAACDYVPLAQILHAVNRQEESRLVREWVLRNTDEKNPPSGTGQGRDVAPLPFLKKSGKEEVHFGSMQRAALAQVALRLPDVLSNPTPLTVNELEVDEGFVLPAPIAIDLRRAPAAEWGVAFQAHLHEREEYLGLAVGAQAMNEALGAEVISPNKEWFLYEADDRILPSLVMRMQSHLLDDLAASPTGLTRAQAQARRWLYELEQARQKLWSTATPNARGLAQVQRQLALRNWEAAYAQTIANTPAFATIMLRTLVAIVIVALLSLGYLTIVGRSWNPNEDGLSLLGFALGIMAVNGLAYRLSRMRIRRLRKARVALAQAELRAQLQESVTDGLVYASDRLADLLTNWGQMLAEAASELNALSTPPTIPAVPPPGVPLLTLYQPHLNPALWERCLDYLKTQQDAQGQRSEDRLDKIWGTSTWRNEMKQILSGGAPQGGQTQARTIAQFIRDTVRQSVAPVSIEQPNTVRSELIRSLAKDFSIEHLLWRSAAEEEAIQRRLRALEGTSAQPPSAEQGERLSNRRYVENAWNRAKPTGNYDVADRLAVYGTTIDFAAASGLADSDLTRALLDEFNVTLLPTENPFGITFVRTVHGLGLRDLGAIARYQAELGYLSAAERALILLPTEPNSALYTLPHKPSTRSAQPLDYPKQTREPTARQF
jgi:hypothetical protein